MFIEAKPKFGLRRFRVARPDQVRVESSCCSFPRELANFDPRQVTRSPPNVFQLGGI